MPILGERRMMGIGGPPYFVDAISEILTVRVVSLMDRLAVWDEGLVDKGLIHAVAYCLIG